MSLLNSLSAALGMEKVDVVFLVSLISILINLLVLIKVGKLVFEEGLFRMARKQHKLNKEIREKGSELADIVLEEIGFISKHLKEILTTESLDNAEQSLRWIMSKQQRLQSLSVQVRRYFGKEEYNRFEEINKRIKIISRFSEKDKTYEIFLMQRQEADAIIKQLIVKVEALLEAVVQMANTAK